MTIADSTLCTIKGPCLLCSLCLPATTATASNTTLAAHSPITYYLWGYCRSHACSGAGAESKCAFCVYVCACACGCKMYNWKWSVHVCLPLAPGLLYRPCVQCIESCVSESRCPIIKCADIVKRVMLLSCFLPACKCQSCEDLVLSQPCTPDLTTLFQHEHCQRHHASRMHQVCITHASRITHASCITHHASRMHHACILCADLL
jgi:hypothetical protein